MIRLVINIQILGVIDQPVLKERWIGLSGRTTTLNGQNVSARSCSDISKAYLYVILFMVFSSLSFRVKIIPSFVMVSNRIFICFTFVVCPFFVLGCAEILGAA